MSTTTDPPRPARDRRWPPGAEPVRRVEQVCPQLAAAALLPPPLSPPLPALRAIGRASICTLASVPETVSEADGMFGAADVDGQRQICRARPPVAELGAWAG